MDSRDGNLTRLDSDSTKSIFPPVLLKCLQVQRKEAILANERREGILRHRQSSSQINVKTKNQA